MDLAFKTVMMLVSVLVLQQLEQMLMDGSPILR
jgi:hypothetical protein